MAIAPAEDGFKLKFIDFVEEVYGIPREKLHGLSYDQINDLIDDKMKREAVNRKK